MIIAIAPLGIADLLGLFLGDGRWFIYLSILTAISILRPTIQTKHCVALPLVSSIPRSLWRLGEKPPERLIHILGSLATELIITAIPLLIVLVFLALILNPINARSDK